MRYGIYLFLIMALVFGAYQNAQNKIEKPLPIHSLKIGMTLKEVAKIFGSPSAQFHNQITYILIDGSHLSITLREKVVSSATLKFQHEVKIQDPDMKRLTLVQMAYTEREGNNTSWFFAGKPSEGLIYKITSRGIIETVTWIPPFSVAQKAPKNLQALLRDFQSQKSM